MLNELSLPLPVPIVFQIAPDVTLVVYAIGLTAVATLLAGLVPAWQATRPGLTSGLKMDEPQYGYRRFTLRNGLIVAQVAITMVLVSVALLFTRSLVRARSLDPGFDLQHTTWARISVLNDRYAKGQVFALASQLLDAANGVPGVHSAALAEVVPLNSFMRTGTIIETKKNAVRGDYYGNSVGPAYFETMGIPILSGRPFAPTDRKGSPDVVIINNALARRLFGNNPAVGERIWFGNRKEGPGVEIVGVAANSKHLTMSESQPFAVYQPIARTQPSKPVINVIVRATADAATVVPRLRDALSSLDDTAAVEVGPLRSKLAIAYLPTQVGAVFVGSLGALGLLLALVGIYGTMAFAVSRRTAEIGIRMALGGSAWQVLRAVLGMSIGTMCTGLAIGLALAVVAARPLAFFLAEGIRATDPATLATVVLICLATGGIAAIIPIRRALSVDPMSALRVE